MEAKHPYALNKNKSFFKIVHWGHSPLKIQLQAHEHSPGKGDHWPPFLMLSGSSTGYINICSVEKRMNSKGNMNKRACVTG